MGIHLFHCTHSEERWPYLMLCEMFSQSLQEMQDFMFIKINSYFFAPYPIIFVLLNRHCVINWWCLHIGKFCHRQDNSSRFGFAGYYFLWGYCNICGSSERWFLSRSVHDKHVSPSSCRCFWMSSLIGVQVFPLMCQHGMKKKAPKVFFSQFCVHFIIKGC
jgi:hypothetical protein